MSAPLLALDGVGKDYAKVESRGGRLRLVFDLLRGHGAAHVFRALDDVSFAMARGESLGIIGENGAGKSTLLKVVAGVIQPTRGTRRRQRSRRRAARARLGLSSRVHGTRQHRPRRRVAGTRAVGDRCEARRDHRVRRPRRAHQRPDQAVLVGHGRAARDSRWRRRSSPDVLITDEVLAVGDESFQKRCIAWMERYLDGGGTLLLCSHSMYHIQKLCTHALWLKDGRVERYGPANDVAQAYLAYHEEKDARAHRADRRRRGCGERLVRDRSAGARSGGHDRAGRGADGARQVFSPDDRTPVVLVGIVRADGTPVYGVATDMEDAPPVRIAAQRYAFSLTFPEMALLPGRYQVRAHALDPEGVRLFDHVEQTFTVTGATRELGFVRLPHRWQAPA